MENYEKLVEGKVRAEFMKFSKKTRFVSERLGKLPKKRQSCVKEAVGGGFCDQEAKKLSNLWGKSDSANLVCRHFAEMNEERDNNTPRFH